MGGPSAVREVLDVVRAERRTSLTAPEAALVCDAYGVAVPRGRFVVSFEPAEARPARYSRGEILATMNRLMRPRAVAVIGASEQPDTIGDTIMRNLVDGGFAGEIYPVDFRGGKIHGRQAYPDVA